MGMESFTDDWGVKYQKIENAIGISYEAVAHPLADATIEELADYNWPDPFDAISRCGVRRTSAKIAR